MKTKIKLLSTAAVLAAATPTMCIAASCSKQQNFFAISETLKTDALAEFAAMAPIYRPSFKTRKICDYLIGRIKTFGLGSSIKEDIYRALTEEGEPDPESSGNIMFDIPATPGMENWPKIAVQGHMDMVCTDLDGTYDWSQGVKLVQEGDKIHSKNSRTSIGADDGIGVGMILALAKNRDSFTHGPIRGIITADEEKGRSGASEKNDFIDDVDYLINFDGEELGILVDSCAGAQECQFEAEFQAADIATDKDQYRIKISGLQGGHSGFEIGKNKINAIMAMAELIEYIQNAPSGNATCLSSIISYAPYTIIPTEVEFDIVVDKLLEGKTIIEYCSRFEKYCKFLHPIETDLKITATKLDGSEGLEKRSHSMTVDDTTKLLEYLTLLPSGVISYIPETGEIETSCNVGGVVDPKGPTPEKDTFALDYRDSAKPETSPVMHLMFGLQGRSSNLDHLGEQPTETTTEFTGFWKYFENITDHVYGSGKVREYLKSLAWVPPWPYKKTKLWDTLVKASTENKVPLSLKGVHAWAEMGYFAYYKPTIQMANIGCRIDDAHQISETLYISSVQPLAYNLVYTFNNIPVIRKGA